MSEHPCGFCCQQMGYMEDVMFFWLSLPLELTRWQRLRHPFHSYRMLVRARVAGDFIDEMGK